LIVDGNCRLGFQLGRGCRLVNSWEGGSGFAFPKAIPEIVPDLREALMLIFICSDMHGLSTVEETTHQNYEELHCNFIMVIDSVWNLRLIVKWGGYLGMIPLVFVAVDEIALVAAIPNS
jgi:hypothetical protein